SIGGDAVETITDLPIEHAEGLAALALIECLADADDRRESARERRSNLPVHRRIGLAEKRAPLRVADDDVLRACLRNHPAADLPGERPFALPVQILPGDADVAVARRL